MKQIPRNAEANIAAISVFDSKYFDYAVRMYVSLRAFAPALRLFAGDLGLVERERNLLAALGVEVLQCERSRLIKDRGLHPTFGHFLLHSYLKGISWDRVSWIDADTLILGDISELYSYDVDVVGHPGRSNKGPIWKLGEIYPFYPAGAKQWIDQHLSCPEDAPYITGGVWCTRSPRFLEFLDSLIDIIPPEHFPGEPPLFTAAIQHLGLSSHQLDPAIWNFGREVLLQARLEDGKIIYGENVRPKTAAFSNMDHGVKASSSAVDQFYATVVRRKHWARPLEPLIKYLREEKLTHLPADKLIMIDHLVTEVVEKNIPGDMVECGTWRGASALVIANAAFSSEKNLHLFDTFEGMPPPSKEDFKGDIPFPGALKGEGGTFGKGDLSDTSVQMVRGLFDQIGIDLERVTINKTWIGEPSKFAASWRNGRRCLARVLGPLLLPPPDLISKFPQRIAFLHIDVDFYEPYRWLLYHLYRRIPHGGTLVFDDYGYWIGAKRAVDEFVKVSGEQLQGTTTSQRFIIKTQRVYVDLDDFCEEYMNKERWALLHELRAIYPKFKVTMFTIPAKSSLPWRRWVKKEYPWIEMAVHGTQHEDREEWMTSAEDAARKIERVFNPETYTKGFKAPWWRLSREGYMGLRDRGFWVATNKTNPFVRSADPLNFTYDAGDEIIPDVHYRLAYFDTWHGHVQTQRDYGAPVPNGLEDIFDRIAQAWHPQSEFGFISELF